MKTLENKTIKQLFEMGVEEIEQTNFEYIGGKRYVYHAKDFQKGRRNGKVQKLYY